MVAATLCGNKVLAAAVPAAVAVSAGDMLILNTAVVAGCTVGERGKPGGLGADCGLQRSSRAIGVTVHDLFQIMNAIDLPSLNLSFISSSFDGYPFFELHKFTPI